MSFWLLLISNLHKCPFNRAGAQSPFCVQWVVSAGFLVSMVIAVPLGYMNLEDNMKFQWASLVRAAPICSALMLGWCSSPGGAVARFSSVALTPPGGPLWRCVSSRCCLSDPGGGGPATSGRP